MKILLRVFSSFALLCLFCTVVCYGQRKTTALAEAYLQSISLSTRVAQFTVSKVRNGDLQKGVINVTWRDNKEDLVQGIRRFHSQKWLITLEKIADQEFSLTSAYGIDDLDVSVVPDPFPEPLVTSPTIFEENHARVNLGSQEQDIVEITNSERWNNGMRAPLKQVSNLHNSADGHSEEMARDDFFAHCDLDTGLSPFQRMQNAGYQYSYAGENIAAGNSTASATMNQWMNSSGHRSNILSTNFREIGVGYEYSNDGQVDRRDQDGNCVQDATGGPYYYYWTQNFGERSSVYPVVIERELAEAPGRYVNLYVYGPSNAESMRFSNDGSSWSDWVAYTPDYVWELSSGNGEKTVYAQVSTGTGTIYEADDNIQLSNYCAPMVFSNTTLTGGQTYTSCEIIADPNVLISGQITFQANSVTLGNNVEIDGNATFEVQIQ
jgi:uncharacterized protein YkwD